MLTFIDPQRFAGTCYRAANWTVMGQTTGRGKDAPTRAANRSIKLVLGYPLVKDFRQRLSCLVLLCYLFCLSQGRKQQGHRGSVRASNAPIRMRKLVIEDGTWRCARWTSSRLVMRG
jgi:hypothetical protein